MRKAILLMVSACCLSWLPGAAADELHGWVDHERVYRLSPGVPGRVATVSVSEGDRVMKGTRLLSLDSRRYETRVAAVSAKLSSVQAEAEEAQRALDRDQALYDEGSLSVVALEQRRLEQLAIASRRQQVEAELAAAQSDLSLSAIDAPATGMIVRVGMAAGEVFVLEAAHPGEILLAGSARVIRVTIDPAVAVPLPVGAEVSISIAGAQRSGVVINLDSASDPGRLHQTIRAEGELPPVGTRVTITTDAG